MGSAGGAGSGAARVAPTGGGELKARSLSQRGLIRAVGVYQWLTAARPPHCRYWPTCSAYAADAITAHGTARGSWMAVRRLGRCHPWAAGGMDPVPVPYPKTEDSPCLSP